MCVKNYFIMFTERHVAVPEVPSSNIGLVTGYPHKFLCFSLFFQANSDRFLPNPYLHAAHDHPPVSFEAIIIPVGIVSLNNLGISRDLVTKNILVPLHGCGARVV